MYDDMGRLTQETVAGETQINYQYDNFQNRSQKTVQNMTDNTVSTTNYSYNRNNQLIQETSGNEEKQYCYDANGNLTAIQQGEQLRSFAYDPLNRMTASTVHNVTTAYTYNGNGLRQTKTTNGVTTSHIYDGQNRQQLLPLLRRIFRLREIKQLLSLVKCLWIIPLPIQKHIVDFITMHIITVLIANGHKNGKKKIIPLY